MKGIRISLAFYILLIWRLLTCGVFSGLPDKQLYPSVSAVYGNTEVSMVYLGPPLDGWPTTSLAQNLLLCRVQRIPLFMSGEEGATTKCLALWPVDETTSRGGLLVKYCSYWKTALCGTVFLVWGQTVVVAYIGYWGGMTLYQTLHEG